MKMNEILNLSIPDFLEFYDRTQKNILAHYNAWFKSIRAFLEEKELWEEWHDTYWDETFVEVFDSFIRAFSEVEEFKQITKLYIDNLRERRS